MRIAGYIEHKKYKITILHMNNRYGIKFETDGFEQTYKIREGNGIATVQDIKSLINTEVISGIDSIFENMKNVKVNMLNNLSADEEDFEEII